MTDIIWKAFSWTAANRPSYLQAIERRESGSHWGEFVPWRTLANLPWKPLPISQYVSGIHLPDCHYYYLHQIDVWIHLPKSKQRFRLLSSFLEDELQSIEIVDGAHGKQLVSSLVTEQFPTIAWLILGQARYEDSSPADELMVWSAYPGHITASIKHVPEFDGSLASLLGQSLPIAVKGL